MRLSGSVLGCGVVLFALVQACSSSGEEAKTEEQKKAESFATPTPITFFENAVNADQHFSDSVDATQPNKLVVQTDGNKNALAKIKVGTVLAGNRTTTSPDLLASKNPYGFLRKVKEIRTEGASTVLVTEQAELSDWIEDGDLDYGNPSSIFDVKTTTQVGDRTLKIRADSGGGSGSAATSLTKDLTGDETPSPDGKLKFAPVVRISNASFKVNANFDGHFKVRTFWGFPKEVRFKSLLSLDPSVGADITAGVSVRGQGTGIGTTVGVTLAEKSFDGPGVVIPLPAPIPITVRFMPRLKCSLSATGEVTATVHAQLDAHAKAGFDGKASFGGIDTNDLSEAPTLQPSLKFVGAQGKASVTAECELLAVPVLLAFDAIGIEGEVGPYVSITAGACISYAQQTQDVDGGFTVYEQHGLAGEFAARVQVPVIGVGKDFPLVSVRTAKSDPLYLVGDAKTCDIKTVDSCEGRADGLYCSVVNTFSAIVCKGETVDHGVQCDSTAKKCTGGTPDKITCQ